MSAQSKPPVEFTEQVAGVHTSCVTRDDGSIINLAIVESDQEFVTYISGEATGRVHNSLAEAVEAVYAQAKRLPGHKPHTNLSGNSVRSSGAKPANGAPLRSPTSGSSAMTRYAVLLFGVGALASVGAWAIWYGQTLPQAVASSQPSSSDLDTRVIVTTEDRARKGQSAQDARRKIKSRQSLTLRDLVGD